MKNVDLYEGNERSFGEILEADWTENTERKNFYGIVVTDDENVPLAGMVQKSIISDYQKLIARVKGISNSFCIFTAAKKESRMQKGDFHSLKRIIPSFHPSRLRI